MQAAAFSSFVSFNMWRLREVESLGLGHTASVGELGPALNLTRQERGPPCEACSHFTDGKTEAAVAHTAVSGGTQPPLLGLLPARVRTRGVLRDY